MTFTKPILVTLLFLTLLGCAINKKKESFEVKELSYGVLASKKTVIANDEDNKSASGNTVLQGSLEVTEKSDSIKGEIGLIFGVQFMIKHKENLPLLVERVWTFPKAITSPNGKRIKNTKRSDYVYTNQPIWMYYTIENKSEIVPGRWVIQYFYKGKEIFKKTFIIEV